jgi:hypothetical protein
MVMLEAYRAAGLFLNRNSGRHFLAKAKISIFAISTFDTDYILVKSDSLENAKKELRKAEYIFID